MILKIMTEAYLYAMGNACIVVFHKEPTSQIKIAISWVMVPVVSGYASPASVSY